MRKIATEHLFAMAAVVGPAGRLLAVPDLAGCSEPCSDACGDVLRAAQPVAQEPLCPAPLRPLCDRLCARGNKQRRGRQRPPDARPGEVWCYVRVPAVTRTEEERVCVRPRPAVPGPGPGR